MTQVNFDLPVCDPETRRALGNRFGPDGRSLFERLRLIFAEETPARLDEAARAVESGVADLVEANLHTIKGNSGTVGATRMHALASLLEEQARGGRFPDAAEIELLRQELQAFIAESA